MIESSKIQLTDSYHLPKEHLMPHREHPEYPRVHILVTVNNLWHPIWLDSWIPSLFKDCAPPHPPKNIQFFSSADQSSMASLSKVILWLVNLHIVMTPPPEAAPELNQTKNKPYRVWSDLATFIKCLWTVNFIFPSLLNMFIFTQWLFKDHIFLIYN